MIRVLVLAALVLAGCHCHAGGGVAYPVGPVSAPVVVVGQPSPVIVVERPPVRVARKHRARRPRPEVVEQPRDERPAQRTFERRGRRNADRAVVVGEKKRERLARRAR